MSLWDEASLPTPNKSDPGSTPTLTMPSGALWIRKYKILVTDAQDKEALNVSELHCTFEVHKRRGRGGFYAIVRIYNLTAETENKLVMEGDRLIIEAGYTTQAIQDKTDENGNEVKGKDGNTETEQVDAQYGKIFDGRIIWPSRSRESNVDYILTLMAIDGDQPLNLNFISKTVNRGLNARKTIETVSGGSEVQTPVNYISEGLSTQAFPRGKVFFGDPYRYIQETCRGNQASFYIENGSLNVTRLQDTAKDEAIVMTPENGLIGTPQQVQFGVSFKILLNPTIHLGSLIKIQGVQVDEASVTPGQQQAPLDDEWIYQAMEITHVGDTRGNDWYTEINGISRYGTGALAALLSNAGQNGNGV